MKETRQFLYELNLFNSDLICQPCNNQVWLIELMIRVYIDGKKMDRPAIV